jgi:hypothetical protein
MATLLDMCLDILERAREYHKAARGEASALRGQIVALQNALRPFATAAELMDRGNGRMDGANALAYVKLADCRTARELLGPHPDDGAPLSVSFPDQVRDAFSQLCLACPHRGDYLTHCLECCPIQHIARNGWPGARTK